jgi:hypothetical protein
MHGGAAQIPVQLSACAAGRTRGLFRDGIPLSVTLTTQNSAPKSFYFRGRERAVTSTIYTMQSTLQTQMQGRPLTKRATWLQVSSVNCSSFFDRYRVSRDSHAACPTWYDTLLASCACSMTKKRCSPRLFAQSLPGLNSENALEGLMVRLHGALTCHTLLGLTRSLRTKCCLSPCLPKFWQNWRDLLSGLKLSTCCLQARAGRRSPLKVQAVAAPERPSVGSMSPRDGPLAKNYKIQLGERVLPRQWYVVTPADAGCVTALGARRAQP